MKLISMIDFVLQESNNENLEKHLLNKNGKEFMNIWHVVFSYAQFLNQPLNISMFCPCKLVKNNYSFLEDPDKEKEYNFTFEYLLNQYQEAKESILFKTVLKNGKAPHLYEIWNDEKYLFTYNSSTNIFLIVGGNIEDLVKYDLNLSENAIKQIGCDKITIDIIFDI